MTLEKCTAAINRNIGVLKDLEASPTVRVAYKTADGWKRLLIPKTCVPALRAGAVATVQKRLDALTADAVVLAIDQALAQMSPLGRRLMLKAAGIG